MIDTIYSDPNYLQHYGVKGMKWGVRRYQNEDGSLTSKGKKKYYEDSTRSIKSKKTGETIYLLKRKPRGLAKLLSKSEKYKQFQDSSNHFDAYVNGRHIGTMMLDKISDKEINGNWLGVKTKERGKGYASAMLDSGIAFAKTEGFKEFTLEVPGHSPDARHIYESKGFKAGEILTTPEEDQVWDGLTAMKKKL